MDRPVRHIVRRLRCDLPMVGITASSPRLWGPLFSVRTLGYLWWRKFDLVHVHALTDALYAAWLCCRLRRLPLIFEMTLIGADDPIAVRRAKNLLSGLRYAIFRRCDGYVAISPALADKYREAGLPAERLRLVSQGVDVRTFTPAEDRAAIRRRLRLPTDGPLLIFVGSLIQRKGIDLLLRAWQTVHAADPRAHLALVGRNEFKDDRDAQRFLAEQLAMVPESASRNLHQLGVRDDSSEYLRAADVFVFPSRREGFGTVIVEAMACRLPCVVARLPGITDYIFRADGRDGIIVPQDDPGALATALQELIAQPSRAAVIAARARERAVEGFSFDRIADCYIDYYRSVLAARRSRLGA